VTKLLYRQFVITAANTVFAVVADADEDVTGAGGDLMLALATLAGIVVVWPEGRN